MWWVLSLVHECGRSVIVPSVLLVLVVGHHFFGEFHPFSTLERDGLPCLGPASKSPLRVYEYFRIAPIVSGFHDGDPYLGLAFPPAVIRANSSDVDASGLLPLLSDTRAQALTCDYGAIFSVGAYLARLQRGVPWLAFQPCDLQWQQQILSDASVDTLQDTLKQEKAGEAVRSMKNNFYFWVTRMEDADTRNLYGQCDRSHASCSVVFAVVMSELMSGEGMIPVASPHPLPQPTDTTLPFLPEHSRGWSYSTAFAMHSSTSFPSFLRFSQMFFVTMYSIWDIEAHPTQCPFGEGEGETCFCKIMDRLVNLWVYHSGRPMILVDRIVGRQEEVLPVAERQMWAHWFADEKISQVYEKFQERLQGRALELFKNITNPILS
eukprot:TRINITY_DN9639_c0_g2_i1.p1 TRINITY_DN9639_c0_g2~~TRINITY_DN9639_c0_g2_i1.p1  ORF type:complete len:378 (+),score=26.05 TRINITY_DN9639_c0_g2_i1:69-1202(+)